MAAPKLATCSFARYKAEMGMPLRIAPFPKVAPPDDVAAAIRAYFPGDEAMVHQFDLKEAMMPPEWRRLDVPEVWVWIAYRVQLEAYGKVIDRRLRLLVRDDKPIVLLCREGRPTNCHRHVFAQWWLDRHGAEVPELR